MSKPSSVMNIVPKFDPKALSSIDWPQIPTVAFDARDLVRDLVDPVEHGWVRSSDGRVGELDVDQQVAHVLRRDEAAGRAGELDDLLRPVDDLLGPEAVRDALLGAASSPRAWPGWPAR